MVKTRKSRFGYFIFYRHTQIVTVYCIAQFSVGEPRRDYTLEEKDKTKG
jgi:hypothetical protein